MSNRTSVTELACHVYKEHGIQLQDLQGYVTKILKMRGVPDTSTWQLIYADVRESMGRNAVDQYIHDFKQKIRSEVVIDDIAEFLEEHEEAFVYRSSRRCNMTKLYRMVYEHFDVLAVDLAEVVRSALFYLGWDSEASRVNDMQSGAAICDMSNKADERVAIERYEAWLEYPSVEDVMYIIRNEHPELLGYGDE